MSIEYYPSSLRKRLGIEIPFMEIVLHRGNGLITITHEQDMASYMTSLATTMFSLTATMIYLAKCLIRGIRLRFKEGFKL